MSFETIRIHRSYPIINDEVIFPTEIKTISVALSENSNSNVVYLSLGSGNNTGSKFGAQRLFELEGVQQG